jgi:hypothetical protein
LTALLEKRGAVERIDGTHIGVVDAVWELATDVESGIAGHASKRRGKKDRVNWRHFKASNTMQALRFDLCT